MAPILPRLSRAYHSGAWAFQVAPKPAPSNSPCFDLSIQVMGCLAYISCFTKHRNVHRSNCRLFTTESNVSPPGLRNGHTLHAQFDSSGFDTSCRGCLEEQITKPEAACELFRWGDSFILGPRLWNITSGFDCSQVLDPTIRRSPVWSWPSSFLAFLQDAHLSEFSQGRELRSPRLSFDPVARMDRAPALPTLSV